MKITKLLALNAKPAQALLARAKKISLNYAQRLTPPSGFVAQDETLENALGAVRPLEVGDVLIDEKGSFYVIEAAPDRLMRISGDPQMVHEAAYAFAARGVRLALTDDGFAMIENEQFRSMLVSVGLRTESYVAPFVPMPLQEAAEEGCCCCGHHHHGADGCGCSHSHEDECGCHDHDCCCGHHHHDEDCGCSHHHDEECSCGCHDHETEETECSCGCGCHHSH